MFNTQHLMTFKALVETGSFTRTAKQLGLTQPAVSQHIQKLESDLGERLLIRHGRTTEITKAGELLLNHIKALEKCYDSFSMSWQVHLMTKNTEKELSAS
ncbi:LysR family transcriptional regulator [Marinomonas ushuaiensis DSM 15871]|uniref:LysR family transcriptional regulator n=1 Tax=Marinomonas ushuaiensis DSM 15871 TaxID=1122207 RepID=X7E4P6_9GAMM|nr:LysR family transcriptional regulator [Marinomonas ushuaiensis]ETX11029.1 LysR family transcriptional regulator [Marinomonas ushuaiensis DSM 15871]